MGGDGQLGSDILGGDVVEILLTEEQIQARVRELGQEISRDYQGRRVHLVGILKGAVIFLADLVRHLSVDLEVDFMAVSSYGKGSSSSGAVQILKDLDRPIEGQHVLIVEDIVDTGLTLRYLMENLKARNPASLKICALLDKPDRRKVEIEADYVGFRIPDRFVVGYGLDYAECYRGLPYIGVLNPSVYNPGKASSEGPQHD